MTMKVLLVGNQVIQADIEPAELVKVLAGPYGFVRCTDPTTNLEFWLSVAQMVRVERATS